MNSNKKVVLVTGANGFIGTRISYLLKSSYSDLFDVVLLTSNKKNGFKCVLHNNYTFSIDDFYKNDVKHIDAIIHLGGFVPKNLQESENFEGYFSTIRNTQYLLNHLPNIPKTFVYCSTISVYGNFSDGNYIEGSNGAINEDSPIILQNLYAITRYCCEKIINEWAINNNVLYHILRLSHVYGVGSTKKAMMKMIENVVAGKDIELWASPHMKRNTIYIDDCCNMIIKSLLIEEKFGIINVCSSENPSYLEIANSILDASKKKLKVKIIKSDYKGKDMVFDPRKRLKYLGLEQFDLKKGINLCYEWIEGNKNENF